MTLRSQLIRLAHQKPELRLHLLPLLRMARSTDATRKELDMAKKMGAQGYKQEMRRVPGADPKLMGLIESQPFQSRQETVIAWTKGWDQANLRSTKWATKWASMMDTFTKAYFEAALWSSTDDEGEPLDAQYDVRDIDHETQRQMVKDCEKFQHENSEYIDMDVSKAGHNFWLSRNGHGAGFLDDDWGGHSRELQTASKRFGEFNLYVGDDGKIYGQKG